MSDLTNILETHERNRIIQGFYPSSDVHLVSEGVSNTLLQIEMAVASRYKKTEWNAFGFEKNGIVDRIIVPRQTNSTVWFSSVVEDDSKDKGREVFDAIDEAKKLFGKEYNLVTLFHSHHELGVSFSGSNMHGRNDEDAFPGFLWYVDESRITNPLEFSRVNDLAVELNNNLIISPLDNNRKPILEVDFDMKGLYGMFLDKYGLSKRDIDAKEIFDFLVGYKIKENILLRDGFSVVFDRKGRFIAKQGFLGEASVKGGDFIHKYRDADLKFVEVDNDYFLNKKDINIILDDRLNIPKPKKYSAQNKKFLDKVYDGTPKVDLVVVERKSKPNFNMIVYEFAEQLVGYLRRSTWANDSKYSCFVANSVNMLLKNSAENLSDGVYFSYLGKSDFTKDVEDKHYNFPRVPESSRTTIARKLLSVESSVEKEFIEEFTYAGVKEKDYALERFFQKVLIEREGGI